MTNTSTTAASTTAQFGSGQSSADIVDAIGSIDEAKALLALAYKGGSYKSKINSALHRLTHAERILRAYLQPATPVEADRSSAGIEDDLNIIEEYVRRNVGGQLALDAIARLRGVAQPSAPDEAARAREPVAWRYKDFADDRWQLSGDEPHDAWKFVEALFVDVAQPEQQPDIRDLLQFVGWVDSWVSNPVGAYSVNALEGLFRLTRERISAISSTEDKT